MTMIPLNSGLELAINYRATQVGDSEFVPECPSSSILFLETLHFFVGVDIAV